MKIVILGGPGSGKTTQATLISQKMNLPFIEMGHLLREKAKENNEQGQQIKKALDAGDLVHEEITIGILKERLTQGDTAKGYILDGFPRNYAQIEGLDPDIDLVFLIRVSDEEGIKRSINRAREDDTLAVLTQRLKAFHAHTEPVVGYFKQKGILHEINGEKSIEEINKEIEEVVGK